MNELLRDAKPGQADAASGTVSYAVLDQALWQKFRNAAGPEEFVEAWLALLCRQIPGVVAGVAVLGEPDVGPFTPVAWWPDRSLVGISLSAIAEKSLAQRQGAVTSGGGPDAAQPVRQIAQPLIVDDRLYGVCAVSCSGSEIGASEILRKMQWAAGWMEVLLRRQMQAEDQEARERSRIAFDMLATVLDNKGIRAASTALVTELALRLNCDPVSVGFVRYRRCSVMAVSHAAGFSKKINLIKDIGAAMDEAVDQRAVVLHPPRDSWEYRVSREHEELAREHKAGGVLTVPLQFDHRTIGAITLIKPAGREFDESTVDLCDAVAAVVGPVLEEKRRNDRNILIKIRESLVRQLERLLGPRQLDGLDGERHGRHVLLVGELAGAVDERPDLVGRDDAHGRWPDERQVAREPRVAQCSGQLGQMGTTTTQLDPGREPAVSPELLQHQLHARRPHRHVLRDDGRHLLGVVDILAHGIGDLDALRLVERDPQPVRERLGEGTPAQREHARPFHAAVSHERDIGGAAADVHEQRPHRAQLVGADALRHRVGLGDDGQQLAVEPAGDGLECAEVDQRCERVEHADADVAALEAHRVVDRVPVDGRTHDGGMDQAHVHGWQTRLPGDGPFRFQQRLALDALDEPIELGLRDGRVRALALLAVAGREALHQLPGDADDDLSRVEARGALRLAERGPAVGDTPVMSVTWPPAWPSPSDSAGAPTCLRPRCGTRAP